MSVKGAVTEFEALLTVARGREVHVSFVDCSYNWIWVEHKTRPKHTQK